MRARTKVIASVVLTASALGGLRLLVLRGPSTVDADSPPPTLRLRGVVRDFRAEHPDFDINSPAQAGHCAGGLVPVLEITGRPEYMSTGLAVASQWYDKDGNPIRPYSTDPGLPGGHFDVDVFDEATDKQLYHKHQFDDAYDVTYVDIVNDPKLLLGDVIGTDYPNPLRLEFLNPHHGSGSYEFEAAGILQSGRVHDGFEVIFDPATLTRCRVNFASLWELRGTNPGTVQKDVTYRDDSFSVRMYDVTTGLLVYELAVYHHIKSGETPPVAGESVDGTDYCGGDIHDTLGIYGEGCSGAVSSGASFQQWYRDVLGTNLSLPYVIELTRNGGVYELLVSDFFPIDDALFQNEGRLHNSHFTYKIAATFTYDACAGQFFEFDGNDDCWVFIDDALAIDLGGVATPHRQYVALDRLALEDGEEYPLDFFFAHRRETTNSLFRMRTNIVLATPAPVPVTGSYD